MRAAFKPSVIAICATLLRLALALRSSTYLDRLFVPDDTYYTLSIARSMARGLGPTADGVHVTSGFQPLLAFLLLPHVSFGLALGIGAVADGFTTWFVSRLAGKLSDDRGAVVAAVIWALSPSAIATALNGLETSLGVACLTGALWAWSEKKPWTGVWLGLSLLARVDSVFLVAAIGVATLRRDGWKRSLASAALAAVVVAPWWGYCLARLGTIVPESGAAVREQAMMYRAAGMVVRDQIAWATGAVVGPPFVDFTPLRELLGGTASGLGMAIGLGLVAGAGFVAWRHRRDALGLLAMHALCIFLFYALYVPATWFFRRYLVPCHVLSALIVAVHARRRAYVAWVPIALLPIATFFVVTPEMTVDQGHHGAKGYAAPAQQILALAPKGAIIGAFQSGALSWFATDARVVNLDGVVDGEAAAAVREHRLGAFVRERGVTHIADWDVNVKVFRARCGPGCPTLERIGEAEPQGAHERFALYRVVWDVP